MTDDTSRTVVIDDTAIERAVNAIWDEQHASLSGRTNIEHVVNIVVLALADELPEDDL